MSISLLKRAFTFVNSSPSLFLPAYAEKKKKKLLLIPESPFKKKGGGQTNENTKNFKTLTLIPRKVNIKTGREGV